MKTINKEVKANTKSANPFNPTSTGGGLHSNMKVTIGADAQAEYKNLPRQIQLVLNYVYDLGGTATKADILKELDNTSFSSTQSKDRIWAFYRQRLMSEGKAYQGANPYLVKA